MSRIKSVSNLEQTTLMRCRTNEPCFDQGGKDGVNPICHLEAQAPAVSWFGQRAGGADRRLCSGTVLAGRLRANHSSPVGLRAIRAAPGVSGCIFNAPYAPRPALLGVEAFRRVYQVSTELAAYRT